MQKLWHRFSSWLSVDLWREDPRQVAPPCGWLLVVYRIGSATIYNFGRNLGGIRAAGLSLTTLLAMVPLLAIAVGLGDLLGYRLQLEAAIVRETSDWPPGLRQAIDTVKRLVDGTSFRALGAVGTAVLVVSIVRLHHSAELALNAIHGVRPRPWWSRLVNLLAVMVVLPPLAIMALFVKSVLQNPWFLEGAADWIRLGYAAGFGIVPHGISWVTFTLLYRWLPNVRVPFLAALIGGAVAGSAWIILFDIYLKFQVGVALNNAIYGTLAALPLLVVYLQMAWTVLLLGAELSHAVQHRHSLRPPQRG
jgi:membrane protein